MDPSTALGTSAQLAVAISGFAGVVVVFRTESVNDWGLVERFWLRLLLLNSIFPLTFSLVGLFLLAVTPNSPAMWRWSSALATFVLLPYAGLIIRTVLGFAPGQLEAAGGNKLASYSLFALLAAVCLLQTCNVAILAAFWPFFGAIVALLLGAMYQFVRLVLTPQKRGAEPFIRAAAVNRPQVAQPTAKASQEEGAVFIRRAEASDASLLAELAARTFAETFGADNSPDDLEAHLESAYGEAQQTQELADPDVRTLLAYRNDELIGFAQVRRKSSPACVVAEQPVELYRFYLARSAHGTGVAKPLMLRARDVARELGGLHLWLGVWERNPRAIAFYRKAGFAKVGSHNFTVGSDTQTDWVFIAPLATQDASAA